MKATRFHGSYLDTAFHTREELIKMTHSVLLFSFYLNRVYFYCKSNLRLTASGWQRKHAFGQARFYLQGIFNYINERTHHFLIEKHVVNILKKMGLHLTNLVSCTFCYIQNSMVLTAGSMFQGYQTLVPGINLNFLEMVWVPLEN